MPLTTWPRFHLRFHSMKRHLAHSSLPNLRPTRRISRNTRIGRALSPIGLAGAFARSRAQDKACPAYPCRSGVHRRSRAARSLPERPVASPKSWAFSKAPAFSAFRLPSCQGAKTADRSNRRILPRTILMPPNEVRQIHNPFLSVSPFG